jgi:hypothetical protein
MPTKVPKSQLSDDARQRMRIAALARAEVVATANREKIRKAMAEMAKEMSENNGAYPYGRGTPSMAEIARRAGIHPVTLHKPGYERVTQEVRDWLAVLKAGTAAVRGSTRKSHSARIDEWRRLYESVKESYRTSETDYALAQAMVAELKMENESLRRQLSQLSTPKVVPMRSLGTREAE